MAGPGLISGSRAPCDPCAPLDAVEPWAVVDEVSELGALLDALGSLPLPRACERLVLQPIPTPTASGTANAMTRTLMVPPGTKLR